MVVDNVKKKESRCWLDACTSAGNCVSASFIVTLVNDGLDPTDGEMMKTGLLSLGFFEETSSGAWDVRRLLDEQASAQAGSSSDDEG